ncbi:MAG: murein hydrolase activator EnvC family protein [Solirubrobacterales bacterium]
MRGHLHQRRRIAATAFVAALFLAVPLQAFAGDPLTDARHELQQTKERIRARAAKMRELQHEMNRIATRIGQTESEIAHTVARQRALTQSIRVLEARRAILQGRLDLRTREAYILGPGAPILYLLTATSAEDAANRIGLLDEMNRRDSLLASKVLDAENRLDMARSEFDRNEAILKMEGQQLALDRAALHRKLLDSRDLFAQLQQHQEEVLFQISKIHPFALCPVQGPHAIADAFGIWVQRSKARGGDHVHQGDDISAAMGTPIVAPFDGTAVAVPNKMGGLAVKVFGKYGYVYNAHLSSYGKLGAVSKGDVIGYVGATGNAGGPHDHFEWHPGNGPAADPYAFLLQVC